MVAPPLLDVQSTIFIFLQIPIGSYKILRFFEAGPSLINSVLSIITDGPASSICSNSNVDFSLFFVSLSLVPRYSN